MYDLIVWAFPHHSQKTGSTNHIQHYANYARENWSHQYQIATDQASEPFAILLQDVGMQFS